uniref:Uncharacterized protein n=1 Tax=Arundo donax TaxID=35708 RepID=A0A0A9H8G8_ARUDO
MLTSSIDMGDYGSSKFGIRSIDGLSSCNVLFFFRFWPWIHLLEHVHGWIVVLGQANVNVL